jgi:hypothetical protein
LYEHLPVLFPASPARFSHVITINGKIKWMKWWWIKYRKKDESSIGKRDWKTTRILSKWLNTNFFDNWRNSHCYCHCSILI